MRWPAPSPAIIMSPGYDDSGWVAKWQAAAKEAIAEPFRTLMVATTCGTGSRRSSLRPSSSMARPTPPFPMDRAERLAKELPHCEGLIRIAGAGHASNLSHPDEVNGPLADFLRRHS